MKTMNNHDKQELFLKYLRDVYIQNPDLEINSDTIYSELYKFYVNNNEQSRVADISLINVQRELANRFSSNFSKGGYFWFTENRNNLSDQEFYEKITNGIKLYISVDAENIYDVVTKTIIFMKENNIITQSKISKILRSDAFVVRVSNIEEANMVINYVNSLNNKSKIEPNPFICKDGKVSITRDGRMSYNKELSNLLEKYLDKCRNNDRLNSVSVDDFLSYVNGVIRDLTTSGLINDNYLMILKIIAKNLDETVTKEYIDTVINNNAGNSFEDDLRSKEDKDKLRYIVSMLSNYYDADTYHKIFEKYISDGNINYFTRRDGIRAFVYNNFSPEKLNRVLNEIGRESLYFAVKTTNDKYSNTNQVAYAIKLLLLNSSFDGFTNDFDARSSLALLVSKSRLKQIIRDEINPSYIQYFNGIEGLTAEEKSAICKSNYTNFTKEEMRLRNIESVMNEICYGIQDSLLRKIEYDFGRQSGRKI